MFRVRVRGLPAFAREADITNFFQGLSSLARVQLFPQLGHAAAEFTRPDDALKAVEMYHGRFLWTEGLRPRRLEVLAESLSPKIVREVYLPQEPTRDALKDRVHRDAVGGQWPKNNKFGIVSYKNRYRRYKPPGNPKPRHG